MQCGKSIDLRGYASFVWFLWIETGEITIKRHAFRRENGSKKRPGENADRNESTRRCGERRRKTLRRNYRSAMGIGGERCYGRVVGGRRPRAYGESSDKKRSYANRVAAGRDGRRAHARTENVRLRKEPQTVAAEPS